MDSDNEDDQMRQMMGFAAFGNKPKHRPKREGATNGAGTSSNLTPLGQRTVQPVESNGTTPVTLPPRPPVAMDTSDRDLDKEAWIAARLPNASTVEGSKAGNEALTGPHLANLTTSLHKPEATTNRLDESIDTSPTFNAQALPFEPPPQPTTTASPFSQNDVRSDPTYWSSVNDKQTQDNTIAYTSPWTGAEMTRKELREFAVGKHVAQSSGEATLTFFKPSFVEEGIWDRWEGKEEEKEAVWK